MIDVDLQCGAGGDTFRLARRGCGVTVVDISTIAVQNVAALRGHVVSGRYDLTDTYPGGDFGQVAAQHLHSPSRWRGGVSCAERLTRCDRAGCYSWDQMLAALDPDAATWSVRRVDAPTRVAAGPGGRTAVVTDLVMIVERVPA